MKSTRIYDDIDKKVARMQKEIMDYAEQIREQNGYSQAMVEIKGFDFNKERMEFELTLKTEEDSLKQYYYIIGAAIMFMSGEATILVDETKKSRVYGCSERVIPSMHGWGAMMVNF